MKYAMIVAVYILIPHITIIRCFEISTMMTLQNIVCQMHLILCITNKNKNK